ncbi:MAG: hypothetical protein AAGF07_00380 [Patescibacteria group bacterium]
MKNNLDNSNDWIVQNTTIETLSKWARADSELQSWLVPRLKKFVDSQRKSVASRAEKMLKILSS